MLQVREKAISLRKPSGSTTQSWASAEIFPGEGNIDILLIPAMSNSRPACGPAECFVRPSLGCRCSKSMLYSDNLS